MPVMKEKIFINNLLTNNRKNEEINNIIGFGSDYVGKCKRRDYNYSACGQTW